MDRSDDHRIADIKIIAYTDYSVVVLAVKHLRFRVVISSRCQIILSAVTVCELAVYLIGVVKTLDRHAVEIALIDYAHIDGNGSQNVRDGLIALLAILL